MSGILAFLRSLPKLVQLGFLIRDGVKAIIAGIRWLLEEYARRQRAKENKKLEEKLEEASKPTQEGETREDMLKRKAAAACEAERILNPKADCDGAPPSVPPR